MQKFNKKFKLRKPARLRRGIGVKKILTKYQLLNKASKVLRKKYFSTAGSLVLKNTPLKNILINMRQRVKFKGVFKKPAFATSSRNSVEWGMFHSFCNRAGISSKIYDVSEKVWINLYAQSYVCMYRQKRGAVSLPRVEVITSPSAVRELAPVEVVLTRRPSKNWIEPSIWKTMSGAQKRAFLVKTGKPMKHNVKHAR